MHEYELKSADEKVSEFWNHQLNLFHDIAFKRRVFICLTNTLQAKVNQKIVLCVIYDRDKQNKDTETKEDETKSTHESSQLKNTAAETNEESACVNLIKEIDQSQQNHDQHKNAEKELDLTLQLWPGEQKWQFKLRCHYKATLPDKM